jgi:hypothetical protein
MPISLFKFLTLKSPPPPDTRTHAHSSESLSHLHWREAVVVLRLNIGTLIQQ